MTLGDKLIELRKKSKMTQEEVADKLKVTRQTISNWELNQTKPDVEQLKGISKIYKVSIDELLDNSIKEILTEKISNTEKLSGLIYKILKGMIICFFVFIGLIVLSVILFSAFRGESSSSSTNSATLSCSIENNNYIITIGDDTYFDCLNCNKQMEVYLKDITDWANLEHSVENIRKYFDDNGGSCD